MPDRNLTVDNRTVASNPAATRVNRLRWVRYYPLWPFVLASLFAVSLFLTLRVSFWFLVLLIPILYYNVFYWIRLKEFFRGGDANPGIVIQLNPTLVAVATDLSQGFRPYPAVKVIQTRLNSMMGESPKLGTRLPTVALYTRGPDNNCPHWIDFDPRPLECTTDDQETLQRVMASFTDEQWALLRWAMLQLPRKEPGLYMLKPEPRVESGIGSFVFAKITDTIRPMERSAKYADPLSADLEERGWGKITGGGTMLNKDGTIQWLGLDIEMTQTDGTLEFIRQRLLELGAPAGSVLEYTEDGKKMTLPIHPD